MKIGSESSAAENSQSQIEDKNEVSLRFVMFQGGFNATAIVQAARMLLTVDNIFRTHQSLVARDSAKITEIDEYFGAEDSSQENYIRQGMS